MYEYEFYLWKAIEESDRKEDFMNRKREERKQGRKDKRTNFWMFICLIFCFIVLIFSFVDALHEDEPVEVVEQSVQYSQTSVRGDNIPASGYSSIELLKAEGLYEESEVVYTHSATFKVTHYCGCSKCCGKWSSGSESDAVGAKGTKLKAYQSIAVDPKVIPLGTILHDSTGKQYVAEDTGSAINGYRIDIFTGNHQEAKELGVKEIELYW